MHEKRGRISWCNTSYLTRLESSSATLSSFEKHFSPALSQSRSARRAVKTASPVWSDIVEFVHFNLLLAWSAWCSQTLGGQLLTSHHHCYPHWDTVISKLSEVTIVCEGLVTTDIVYCSTEVIKKVRMTHENWTNVVVCLLIIHLYMQGVMKPAKEIINLVSK